MAPTAMPVAPSSAAAPEVVSFVTSELTLARVSASTVIFSSASRVEFNA